MRAVAMWLCVAVVAAGCSIGDSVTVSEPAVVPDAPVELGLADAAGEAELSADSPLRISLNVDADRGRLVDGEYQPNYEGVTFHWVMRIDTDASQGYLYTSVDGVAEPGDSGCSETLIRGDAAWVRYAFAPDDQQFDFEVVEGGDPEAVLATMADFVPLTAEHVYGAVSLDTPTGETLGDGLVRRVATYGAGDTVSLFAVLPDVGGVGAPTTSSTIETIEQPDGRLRSLTFEGLSLGDESAVQSREEYRMDLTIDALGTEEQRVQPQMSRQEIGTCVPRTDGIVGEWELLSLVDGGSEAPAQLLGEAGAVSLSIDTTGVLTGSTGCRTFSGMAAVEYAWLVNVEVDLEGAPCTGEALTIEEAVISAIAGDPAVWIDDDDRLWLSSGEDDGLLLIFGRG